MSDPQMSADLNSLVLRTELVDVVLNAERALAFFHPDNVEPDLIEYEHAFTYAFLKTTDASGSSLFCFPSFELKAKRVGTGDDVFQFECAYAVVYRLEGPFPDERVIAEFARTQAFVNGLPFIRENTVTVLAKMGFRRFVLPMLKPGYGVNAVPRAEQTRGEAGNSSSADAAAK